MKYILRAALVILLAPGCFAAAPTRVPILTATQQLQLKNTLQAVEIARLRAEAAAAELQRTGAAAQAFLKTLVVPGWQLNLETFEYSPTPKGKK